MYHLNSMKIKRLLVINCICFFVCFNPFKAQQIANYVSNGSFEDHYSCSNYAISIAKGWRNLDSAIFGNSLFYSTCYPNVPSGGLTYQWPRSGLSFAFSSFLCQPPLCSSTNNRGYYRNRLKSTLQSGKVYCVTFYVSLSNSATYGIDGVGAYFGNTSIDTITKTEIPLTYLVPQVQNPINNIITDTLNWVSVTGTFVANGTEKYMVIGNFKSDVSTNKVLINPTNLPTIFADFGVDDVSCIPIDLPAYAGPDIWGIPNNTVYIGRQQDVGIDEACMWYKLPNTTTAIDTSAGITVSVGITTNTYIVRQEICGNIKWDTVVVHASGLGNVELEMLNDKLKLYPNPANEILNIESFTSSSEAYRDAHVEILNSLGQLVQKNELVFKNNATAINTKELANGVYVLKISSVLSSPHWGDKRRAFSKRFVISR